MLRTVRLSGCRRMRLLRLRRRRGNSLRMESLRRSRHSSQGRLGQGQGRMEGEGSEARKLGGGRENHGWEGGSIRSSCSSSIGVLPAVSCGLTKYKSQLCHQQSQSEPAVRPPEKQLQRPAKE
eukprot:COSAG06_NODE_5567_length_3397_cov_3.112492_1_plen_123_part_00